MANNRPSNKLSKALFDCFGLEGYRSDDYFRWFVNDVLHGFGVQPTEGLLPPEETHKTLFELGGIYAGLVQEREPFYDVIGDVYMDLVSMGGQKHLGQYFTPWSIANLMTSISMGDHVIKENRLTTLCDPAVGSGVMMLSACSAIVKKDPELLKWVSLTGVDLDPICARIFPAQVLGNLLVHQLELGELVAYHGSTLGDPADLNLVIHTTRRNLDPDLLISADPVIRKPMIKQAAQELHVTGDQLGFSFKEVTTNGD